MAFRVDVELEVEILDVDAARASAIERVNEREYGDRAEHDGDIARVLNDVGEVVLVLIDPDLALGSEALEPNSSKVGVTRLSASRSLEGPTDDFIPKAGSVESEPYPLALLRASSRARDLDDLFEPGDGADDLDSIAQAVRRVEMLKGAAVHAAESMIDGLFQDIETVRSAGAQLADAIPETLVLSGLSPRFAHRYDQLFAQRFLVAAADVTRRFTTTWTFPSNVAQELALRCLLDEIEVIADTSEEELPRGWRARFESAFFEDTDHEYLYTRSADGFEDDPDFGPPGMVPLGFDDWFVPFPGRDDLPPYAESSVR